MINKIKTLYGILKNVLVDLNCVVSVFIERIFRKLTGKTRKDGLKVIIVGPPRSGTSFLAGLIVRMGFYPGPSKMLLEANKNNPYGFYEFKNLLDLDHRILEDKYGSIWNIPDFDCHWISDLVNEKNIVKKTVNKYGLEVYKGNMLIVLSDLYSELFPDAKWIFITRSKEETKRSIRDAWGSDKSDDELDELLERWLEIWNSSQAGKKSLKFNYEDFFKDIDGKINELESFLEIELTAKQRKDCKEFFKPRNEK